MRSNKFVTILSVAALLMSVTVYLNTLSTSAVQAQGAKGTPKAGPAPKVVGPIYAQLSSMKTQTPKAGAAIMAMMESNDALSAGGLIHNDKTDTDKITVKTDGVYFLIAACQVGRSSGASDDYVDVWMQVNGKDVDNSNTRQTIKDPAFTSVLVCQGIAELKANDVVTVAYSVSAPDKGLGIIATSPKGEPGIPSIIFSMYKVN